MGGRGARSSMSSSFTTGDKTADKIIKEALKKFEGDMPTTRLAENFAKRILKESNGDPIQQYLDKMEMIVKQNDRHRRDIANFEKEIAQTEKTIARYQKIAKEESKKTKVVDGGVFGTTVKESKAYGQVAKKLVFLEQGKEVRRKELASKKKAVANFNKELKKEAEFRARVAQRAVSYKKKRK